MIAYANSAIDRQPPREAALTPGGARRSSAGLPRPSLPATLMTAWLACVFVHLARFVRSQMRFRSELKQVSPVESGEAFVQILRHAGRGRRGLEGALGVFGLDSRTSCLLRARRLLDTDRPIRSAPGAWLLWALIGLAVVSVPHLRAAGTAIPAVLQNPSTGSAAATQRPSEVRTGIASDGESREFELRVVGPGGKEIPNAVVEVRTDPLPTADQVRTGKFLRRAKYGSVLSTDAAGRLVIKLLRPPQRLNVDITTPG